MSLRKSERADSWGSLFVRCDKRVTMSDDLLLRVAKEFPSPAALKEYLHEHPDADRSKHTVKKGPPALPPKRDKSTPPPLPPKKQPEVKKEEAPAKAKRDEGEDKPKAEEDHGHTDKPKKTWKERFTGLSEQASSFMKSAPKNVQRFVGDPDFRNKTFSEAKKTLTKSPEALTKRLISTAKEEVKEYKEASKAIASYMKGEKVDPHHKKALKAVMTHIAIGAAAAALTASGPLAGAGMFGKAMVKHVALKAVSHALGKAHVLEELGHIGHGVMHLVKHMAAEGDKKPKSDEVLANLVMAAVAKQLEDMDDAAIEKVLEKVAGKDAKKASILRVAEG
jgi:hypothetical protein